MRLLVTISAICLLTTPALASDPPALVTSWGGLGSGPGQFDHPRDVAVAPDGNVYVVDALNNRVQYFTSSGGYLGEWGGTGTGPGQFQDPRQMAIDKDGNVYVSDGANRVQKFSATGGYLMSFVDTLIVNPHGVCVDPDGNLYAGSKHTGHISKFDAAGNFVMEFTSPGWGGMMAHDLDGSLVANEGCDLLQRFSDAGALIHETACSAVPEVGSRGVAIDASGNLFYVPTDTSNPDEIHVLSYWFGPRDSWLPPRPRGWAVPAIEDLAPSTDGFVYLADAANNRILKVQYSAPVPTSPVTWGKVKAQYR